MNRVFILGIDGYLGWRLQQHLRGCGHRVSGCDNFFRREVVKSLVPIVRTSAIPRLDIRVTSGLREMLKVFKPDTVVHLAEIPSAPYSMKDAQHTIAVQDNNVIGSLSVLLAMREVCPEAHLIKLGSMGEYIPSSWYHMSKVLDSKNCEYASQLWGARITDVMQGPVYGVGGRFDYDECWGTVVNRWVCMGLAKHDILVYGDGAQVRGFLPIQDSMRCFEIEVAHPPKKAIYRRVNQYAKKHPLKELAGIVASACGVKVKYIPNPRIEANTYEGDTGTEWLEHRGYDPSTDTEAAILELIEHVRPYRDNIDTNQFLPKVRW
jgi:UDP-sulfoquinovose synthase